MTKGNYDISETAISPNDTSFRNCICAVLLFIGMCILIVIMATFIPSRDSTKSTNGGDSSGTGALEGGGYPTTTSHRPRILNTLKPTNPPRKPPVEETKPEYGHKATTTEFNRDVEGVDGTQVVTRTPDRKQYLVIPEKPDEDTTVSSTLATTITTKHVDGSKKLATTESTIDTSRKNKTDDNVIVIGPRFGGGASENDTTTPVTTSAESATSSLMQSITDNVVLVTGSKFNQNVKTTPIAVPVTASDDSATYSSVESSTDNINDSTVIVAGTKLNQNVKATPIAVPVTASDDSATYSSVESTTDNINDSTVIVAGTKLNQNVKATPIAVPVTTSDESATSSSIENTTDSINDSTVIAAGIKLNQNVKATPIAVPVTTSDESATSSSVENTTDSITDNTVIAAGTKLNQNVNATPIAVPVTTSDESATSSSVENTTDSINDSTVIVAGTKFNQTVKPTPITILVTTSDESDTSTYSESTTNSTVNAAVTKLNQNLKTTPKTVPVTTSDESATSSSSESTTDSTVIAAGTKLNQTLKTTPTPPPVPTRVEPTTNSESISVTTEEQTTTATDTSSNSTLIGVGNLVTQKPTMPTTDNPTIVTGTPSQASTPSSRNQVTATVILAKRSYQSTTEQIAQEEGVVSEFDGHTPDEVSESVAIHTGGGVIQTKAKLLTECTTDACKSTVSRMLGLIDHRTDGCEDFYQYSCGDNANPEEMQHKDFISSFYSAVMDEISNRTQENFPRKFKEFYTSCVNHEKDFNYRVRVNTASQVVKKAEDMFNETVDKTAVTKLFAKLVLLNSFPLMKVNIDVDDNTNKYILQIALPDRNFNGEIMDDWPTFLALERRCVSRRFTNVNGALNLTKIYEDYLECRNDPQSYGEAVENVLSEIDLPANLSILYDLDKGMMKFLNNNAQNSTRNPDDNRVITIAELQQIWTIIDWRVFFQELTGNTVQGDMIIEIVSFTTLNAIMKGFQRYWMYNRSNELYKLFLIMYATDVYQNIVLPKHTDNRLEYCVELSNYLFHDVSSFIHLHSVKKETMTDYSDKFAKIFGILTGSLRKNIQDSTWVSSEDKDLLNTKLKNLVITTANLSSNCLGDAELTARYDAITTTQNFTWDLLTFMETKQRNLFALAGKNFHESDMFCYFVHPYERRPKSFYGSKTIAVPYGLITSADVPNYILMTRVGIHLAQEIGKHFDPLGINANLQLSEDGKIAYRDNFMGGTPLYKTGTVNQQEVKFSEADITMTNQEIADSAALKMLTETYQTWLDNTELPWIKGSFSTDQIFYITVAQEFCRKTEVMDYMLHLYDYKSLPPPLRVDVMFMNSKTFSTSFNCAEGAGMNYVPNRIQFPAYEEIDK